jgi:3-phosphoshikimate 1-carboxyvinyltransferase
MGAGARIRMPEIGDRNGETAGDLLVEGSCLRGGTIEGAMTAALIDEIPILAVLGTASEDGLVVKNAKELRIKETDRIATIAENLRRMGAIVEELPDGLVVPGRQKLRGAELDSFGDHRIAMAFTVAALCAEGESALTGADAAGVSFPEFFPTLRRLVA